MRRRDLFKRLGAVAVASAAPVVAVQASEPVQATARIRAVAVHTPEPWLMTLHYVDGTSEVVDIETGAGMDSMQAPPFDAPILDLRGAVAGQMQTGMLRMSNSAPIRGRIQTVPKDEPHYSIVIDKMVGAPVPIEDRTDA